MIELTLAVTALALLCAIGHLLKPHERAELDRLRKRELLYQEVLRYIRWNNLVSRCYSKPHGRAVEKMLHRYCPESSSHVQILETILEEGALK